MEFSTLPTLFVGGFLLLVFLYVYQRPRTKSSTSLDIPTIGFFDALLHDQYDFKLPEWQTRLSQQLGPIYASPKILKPLFGPKTVYVTDAQVANAVLNSKLTDINRSDKDLERCHSGLFDSFAGTMSSANPDWKTRRDILANGLTAKLQSNLEHLVGISIKRTSELVDAWKHKNSDVVDLHESCNNLILDVLGIFLLGHDFNSIAGYRDNQVNLSAIVIDRLMFIIEQRFLYSPKTWFFRKISNISPNVTTTKAFLANMIKKQIRQVQKGDNQQASDIHMSLFPQLLTQNARKDDEIIADVLGLFLYGYQTTSTTLCLLIVYLSKNKDYYAKVKQEIQKIWPSNSSENVPTIQALSSLKHLENACLEVLRLHPPFPTLQRKVADNPIKIDDYLFEKQTVLQINIHALHNSPKYWDIPESFNPDRFKSPKHPQGAFFPFGEGSHRCFYKDTTVLVLKCCCAYLIKRVESFGNGLESELEFLISFSARVSGNKGLGGRKGGALMKVGLKQ